MEDFFKLKANKTTVRQEVVAGVTTFATIAYIIFVNPAVLSKTGMDFQSVLVATCIAGAVGCLLSGLLANYPFAQAPGMGLNAFFVYTVVFQAGYTWQSGLAIVFISGILFILLTVTGLRSSILEAFPPAILKAIPAGIGLFIAVIGLNNAGIIDINQGPIIDILLSAPLTDGEALVDQVQQAPPQIIQFGDLSSPSVAMAIFGFVLMTALVVRKVKGAILLAIVAVTIISIFVGTVQMPESITSADISLSPTLMKLDFGSLLPSEGSFLVVFLEFFTLLIAFTMVDLFDTLGTLYGTAEKGGFLTKDGKLPRIKRAMLADAVATTVGALVGTSTTTTYIESGSGIAAGGRTGLTSVVVAVLFLVCIFFAPIAAIIPTSATAPALIMVGVFMISSIRKINLDDLQEAIPAFLTIVLMPLTYSIANGIGAGIIFFVFIKLITGQGRQIKPVLWIVALLFVIKFAFITA